MLSHFALMDETGKCPYEPEQSDDSADNTANNGGNVGWMRMIIDTCFFDEFGELLFLLGGPDTTPLSTLCQHAGGNERNKVDSPVHQWSEQCAQSRTSACETAVSGDTGESTHLDTVYDIEYGAESVLIRSHIRTRPDCVENMGTR